MKRVVFLLTTALVLGLGACGSRPQAVDRPYALETFETDIEAMQQEGSLSDEQASQLIDYDARKRLQGNKAALTGRTYRQLLAIIKTLPPDSLVAPDPGPMPPPPPPPGL